MGKLSKDQDPRRLFPALSRREAEVYYLHERRGLRHREIAERLGISRRSSEAYLFRARRKIEAMRTTLRNVRGDGD